MKLILLTAGGRAGSDFFHSLLDGHPEILQFPGYLRVDNNLKLILKTENLKVNLRNGSLLNFLGKIMILT